MKMKKIIGMLLSAVLAVSMSACTFSTPSVVMTVEGEEIPAGLYLMYQYQAYTQASSQVDDPAVPTLKNTIEGKKAEEWIHEQTVEGIKRCIWTEKAFAEKYGEMTPEETAAMEQQIDSIWQANSKQFEVNGIGRESYTRFFKANMQYERMMYEDLFENEASVSLEEGKKYMNEHYTRVQMLLLPIGSDDGVVLEGDALEEVKTLAQQLVEKLNQGGNFDELGKETLQKACEISGRAYTEELLEAFLSKGFVSEGSREYPKEVVEKALASQEGQADVYYSSNVPMVYQRIANFADDAEYEKEFKKAIESEIVTGRFADAVKENTASYEVVEDAAAVKTYAPSKIK